MSTDSPVSRRAATLASVPSQQRINTFLRDSVYARRQHEPGICDLALGNPHQMPQAAYVEALADALTPRNERWFAYKTNEPEAQAAAAASLQRLLGMPFEPADIHLTTGGFTAIPLALKAVADPGDEVIFTLPPWFFYEPLVIEAGLVPVKIRCDPETFDVDLAALGAAITPRTRVVIVNTPNNPTGRIYPPVAPEGPGGHAGRGLAQQRPAGLPALRRAVQPDCLRRCPVPQPRRILSVHTPGLLVRQDPSGARAADRLPGAAAHHAGPRPAAGGAHRPADGDGLDLPQRPAAVRAAAAGTVLDRRRAAAAQTRPDGGGADRRWGTR